MNFKYDVGVDVFIIIKIIKKRMGGALTLDK